MYKFMYTDDDITWHLAMTGANTGIHLKHGDRRPLTEDRLQDAYKTCEFLLGKHKKVKLIFPDSIQ